MSEYAGSAARADRTINERAVEAHALSHGAIQTMPKCPIGAYEDLGIWYTPGVAAISRAVVDDPDRVFELTCRGNTAAVLSDGSRVLGLGDIGPVAGLPVMEGKALLFKYFGGVDAIPICVDVHEPDEIIAVAKALAPSFGGINLEDIATPKCYRVLDRLRTELPLPVWHDDQQGTAVVVLAGLINALKVVGKRLDGVRIALVGIGAANMAVYRLLRPEGVAGEQVIVCDSRGILYDGRADLDESRFSEKCSVARETNPERLSGGIAEALSGADVCLAFSRSGPGVIPAQAVSSMAQDAIIFACANPVPEIWPEDASAAGARIVATGRSDFANQVNNSLAFPGVFRGALDVRARAITDGMAKAAAETLAALGREQGLDEQSILPRTDDPNVAASLAAATGMAAQADGVAGLPIGHDALFAQALETISKARQATELLMQNGLIVGRNSEQAGEGS